MDTNEFYSDYNDLITKGKIAVTKRAVPKQLTNAKVLKIFVKRYYIAAEPLLKDGVNLLTV